MNVRLVPGWGSRVTGKDLSDSCKVNHAGNPMSLSLLAKTVFPLPHHLPHFALFITSATASQLPQNVAFLESLEFYS